MGVHVFNGTCTYDKPFSLTGFCKALKYSLVIRDRCLLTADMMYKLALGHYQASLKLSKIITSEVDSLILWKRKPSGDR